LREEGRRRVREGVEEGGTKSAEAVNGVWKPPCAGDFEAALDEVLAGAFDDAGANGQMLGNGRGVVELLEPVLEVTQGAPRGSLLIGDIQGFEPGGNLRENGERTAMNCWHSITHENSHYLTCKLQDSFMRKKTCYFILAH
jgi:hypothetical protein